METCRICNSHPGSSFDTPICTGCWNLGFRYCPSCNSIGFDPGTGIWIAPDPCNSIEH